MLEAQRRDRAALAEGAELPGHHPWPAVLAASELRGELSGTRQGRAVAESSRAVDALNCLGASMLAQNLLGVDARLPSYGWEMKKIMKKF